jgi:hypothetical protein
MVLLNIWVGTTLSVLIHIFIVIYILNNSEIDFPVKFSRKNKTMIHHINQTYFDMNMPFSPHLEFYTMNYSSNFLEDIYYEVQPKLCQIIKQIIRRINFASTPEVVLTCFMFISTLWSLYIYTVTIPRLQSLATPPAVKLVKEQETTTVDETSPNREIEYDSQANLHEFILRFEELGGTYSQIRGWTVKKFIRKTGGRKGKPYFLYYNRRGKEYRSVKRIIELFDI